MSKESTTEQFDVVEAMRQANLRGGMADSFDVCAVWCKKKTLADPNDEELQEACRQFEAGFGGGDVLRRFLARRRAQPLLPAKTVEERVTVTPWIHDPSKWIVLRDGWNCSNVNGFTDRKDAERYRLGIIAELKQETRVRNEDNRGNSRILAPVWCIFT